MTHNELTAVNEMKWIGQWFEWFQEIAMAAAGYDRRPDHEPWTMMMTVKWDENDTWKPIRLYQRQFNSIQSYHMASASHWMDECGSEDHIGWKPRNSRMKYSSSLYCCLLVDGWMNGWICIHVCPSFLLHDLIFSTPVLFSLVLHFSICCACNLYRFISLSLSFVFTLVGVQIG